MCTCTPPSSTMRRASAPYSSGVEGIAGHWSRLASDPEIEQVMTTGSSRLTGKRPLAGSGKCYSPPFHRRGTGRRARDRRHRTCASTPGDNEPALSDLAADLPAGVLRGVDVDVGLAGADGLHGRGEAGRAGDLRELLGAELAALGQAELLGRDGDHHGAGLARRAEVDVGRLGRA